MAKHSELFKSYLMEPNLDTARASARKGHHPCIRRLDVDMARYRGCQILLQRCPIHIQPTQNTPLRIVGAFRKFSRLELGSF